MKEVPVKVEHNKQWVVVKLGVGEDRLVIPAPINKEILFKTVLDVAERKNILIITVICNLFGLLNNDNLFIEF